MITVSSIGSAFTPDTTSAADKSSSLFLDNTQRFLNLLVTQLKYQDPTQPLGVEQMSQQMATLSTVQQSIETNKNLEKLVAMQNNSQASSATNLINKEVEYLGSDFYMSTSETEQKFSYTLGKDYQKALVQVSDDKGRVLYQVDKSGASGEQAFVWDGKDNDGARVPAGKYVISVNGLNEDDQYENIATLTKDIVSGVDFKTNGEPTLVFGDFKTGVRVGLSNVGSVNVVAANTQSDNETETN